MNRTDVQGTLQEMWETRPARPRQDRKVAGVASAIARRYDIDPVLVRIGFVAATFAGIGAALYVAGWVLLPDEPADPAAPPTKAPRTIAVVALAIAAALTIGSFFSGPSDVVLPILAVAGLLFLLHRSRADRGSSDGPAAATSRPSLVKEPAGDALHQTPSGQSPPAWDPLGAAPFAWDLPEPGPPASLPPPRRPPVTPVTLGLALLAGSVTAAVLLLAGALTPANVPLLFGVVLAVLGSGLVVGAFLRSGRGLIPIALLVSALTWAAVAAPLERWHDEGIGDIRAAPTTVADLLPSYETSAGEISLDLRGLDLAVPADGDGSPVQTSVSLDIGTVQVFLPRNADVRLTASADIGRVAFGDQQDSGPEPKIEVTEDLGEDDIRSGRLLVLDIAAGGGNVEVHRG